MNSRLSPSAVRAIRRRILLGIVVIAAVAAAVAWIREYALPKRFAVVVPGQLYRCAYARPWVLERIMDQNGIGEILCLLKDEAGDDRVPAEQKVAAEKRAVFTRVPMPGNGCADFESLDRAADAIEAARLQKRPILVHCSAGVQRTNASIMAWRIRYCGWTCEQALEEAQRHWLDRQDNPTLFEHIRQYARQAATRPASTRTSGG